MKEKGRKKEAAGNESERDKGDKGEEKKGEPHYSQTAAEHKQTHNVSFSEEEFLLDSWERLQFFFFVRSLVPDVEGPSRHVAFGLDPSLPSSSSVLV